MSKLPKWFEGEVYTEGTEVKNPFTQESCKLNANELSMYDFIMGSQLYLEIANTNDPGGGKLDAIIHIQKGLDWFKENNLYAYHMLLV